MGTWITKYPSLARYIAFLGLLAIFTITMVAWIRLNPEPVTAKGACTIQGYVYSWDVTRKYSVGIPENVGSLLLQYGGTCEFHPVEGVGK